MLNIAIAEDQVLFRKGIISLLNTFNKTKVCIEAQDGEDMLRQLAASEEQVHVALIDINMPRMNGIELMKEIRRLYPAIKNIILTIHEEEKYIHKFIEEGANAYLVKNSEPAEVERAIRTVITHDYYFNEKIVSVMHGHMQKGKKRKTVIPGIDLTAREREVLQLICRELTGPEISKKLFISESTVNGHRNNLLLKIGCRNTAGMVLYAIKNGIFDMDEPDLSLGSKKS